MHPAVSPEGAGAATKFRSLKDLRRALESQHGLQFCTICLAGRKVDPHSNPPPYMAAPVLQNCVRRSRELKQYHLFNPNFQLHTCCCRCKSGFAPLQLCSRSSHAFGFSQLDTLPAIHSSV